MKSIDFQHLMRGKGEAEPTCIMVPGHPDPEQPDAPTPAPVPVILPASMYAVIPALLARRTRLAQADPFDADTFTAVNEEIRKTIFGGGTLAKLYAARVTGEELQALERYALGQDHWGYFVYDAAEETDEKNASSEPTAPSTE